MQSSLAFILGLLDHHSPAHVSWKDFVGEHGRMLRLWQRMGFLSEEPGRHPVPSCPHCLEGVPYLLGGRYVCNACHSTVDCRHLFLWRFDLEAFLTWLAETLKLDGGVRQVDERLWQLGSLTDGSLRFECFFCRNGSLSDRGQKRLLGYRNALLFRTLPQGNAIDGFRGPSLSLLEILRRDKRSQKMTALSQVVHGKGPVRFDEDSGAVWAGDVWLGEVPVGSKEFHLLACLAQHVDRFVAYGDIKHYVLRRAGSTDTTEEATFCQRLKNRIKHKKWIPKIDLLLTTTNKGDGYRLRRHLQER